MGMYDSVMLNCKCPWCGEEKVRELQTKDEDCRLKVWREGDFVSPGVTELAVITECRSRECFDQNKNGGYGMGKFITGKVFLKDGRITKEYELEQYP